MMGLSLGKGKDLPIGVDVGSAALKMAQLRQGDHGLELAAAAFVEIPQNCRHDLRSRLDFAGQQIRWLMKSDGFKFRQSVLSLPAEATFIHHAKIPKMPSSEIPRALEWELQGKLPYPVEEAVIRYVRAGDVFGDGEAKQEVIVVAAAKATVDACVTMASRSKLDLIGINVEPCAIVECFARLVPGSLNAARTTLYVDIGAASTKVVLAQGRRIAFARNLVWGSDRLDQIIADALKVPPQQAHSMRYLASAGPTDQAKGDLTKPNTDELHRLLDGRLNDLAQELIQCLRYYESVFRNQPVERVIFLGGGAYDKQSCQAIAQRLNLAAQIGDPLAQIKRAAEASMTSKLTDGEPRPDWAVAVGLSLGANVDVSSEA